MLAAQIDNGVEIGPGLTGSAVGAFLTTPIVDWIMVAIANRLIGRRDG